jgi:DNA recombination protein RmuC
MKAASYGWRQESIADNAREISQLGQELHGRLAVMADHLTRLGKSLGSATDSYNSAIASFESRVLVSARKFKELGATSQEAEIIELRAVEGGVRRLQLAPDKAQPDEKGSVLAEGGLPPCTLCASHGSSRSPRRALRSRSRRSPPRSR